MRRHLVLTLAAWFYAFQLLCCAGQPVFAGDFPSSPIAGGGAGTTSASDLSTGTLPAARIADNSIVSEKLKNVSGTPSATTFFRGDNTWATPAGSGTVTGPAAATADNVVTWGADNTSIKDSGVTISSLVSGSTSIVTVGTITTGVWNGTAHAVANGGTGATTAADAATNLGLGVDNSVTFSVVTAGSFVSNAADNTKGISVPNTADPTGANLELGLMWFNKTSNMVKQRNGDNSATLEVWTSGAAHTLNFATTGTLTAGVNVVAKTDNVTLSGAEVYGTMIECGAGCNTITLPAKVQGMSVCVMATDNTQKNVDVNGSDAIVYSDGTDFGNGHKATSVAAGAVAPTGEFICLYGSATANKWRVTGRGASAWSDGS